MKLAQEKLEDPSQQLIMAVMNITPDSFSDGGELCSEKAIAEKLDYLKQEKPDILDIGAESTRPNASKIDHEEELKRLNVFFEACRGNIDIPLSIDTYKSKTAEYCCSRGCTIVNDINGLQGEADIVKVVKDHDCHIVIMHNSRIIPIDNKNVIPSIKNFFAISLEIAYKHNIPKEKIILDPGIGFGKKYEDNIIIIKNLHQLKQLGYPILIGLSKKSMFRNLLNREVTKRLSGTIAANLIALQNGAKIIRVHDIAEHIDMIKVFNALK